MTEKVEATTLTIYVGDSFRYRHGSLYRAIGEMLHEEGVAGATVIHGIEGYGGDKQKRTARIFDLSRGLPLVIIAIDRKEKVEVVLPKLDEMMDKGVVTTEETMVVFSRPAPI